MDKKTTELIAVGASVTANCQPCLKYHLEEALKNGASEDEIAEAISVAKMVRRGATAKMDRFAAEVLKTEPADTECDADKSECG